MNPVYVRGIGAVTPAGWGIPPLRDCLNTQRSVPLQNTQDPLPCSGKVVPTPDPRPAVLGHPRLRRSSAISQYAAAAAFEALAQAGCDPSEAGIVFGTMCGSVRYTRRFYAEARIDPATASPILFPETVFNAPASHIAAALGATIPTYTLVGDSSIYLQALALGAQWVAEHYVKYCLVIASEELDWSVVEGWKYFSRNTVLAEGAAAMCLSQEPGPTPSAVLTGVTDLFTFAAAGSPHQAALSLRDQLPPPHPDELLVDGRSGLSRTDAVESRVWPTWPGPRLSPKTLLGEGMSAAVGWQCVTAVDHLQRDRASLSAAQVIAIGCNHQAVGALFHAAASP